MIPDDDPASAEPESYIDRLRREHAQAALQDGGAGPVPPNEALEPPGTPADTGATLPDDTSSTADGDNTSADAGVTDRMPPEARRALVSLMRQGVVLAARKGKVFDALVRHQAPVRAHLAETYLELVLDEPAGVAFIRNRVSATESAEGGDADSDDDAFDDGSDAATLISRRTLSLYDTLLLLTLRKHYQDRQTAGEQRIVIDVERVESALVPFLPLTVSERSDRRQLNAALSRLVDKRLLSRVRGDDERFEITPVIRYVVDAAFLDTLLVEYERMAGTAGDEAES